MTHFILCHGFGFNSHFWDKLTPYFAPHPLSLIDLGYFSQPTAQLDFTNEVLPSLPSAIPSPLDDEPTKLVCKAPAKPQAQPIVGIGHSLGLLKLVELYPRIDLLVGLNGFVNFLGNCPKLRAKRSQELAILQKNFLKNPRATLHNFYRRCQMTEFGQNQSIEHLNLDLILADLASLTHCYPLPKVPTLILNSSEDSIVPDKLGRDNFAHQPQVQLEFLAGTQHNVGFSRPHEVYLRIMEFLNEQTTK